MARPVGLPWNLVAFSEKCPFLPNIAKLDAEYDLTLPEKDNLEYSLALFASGKNSPFGFGFKLSDTGDYFSLGIRNQFRLSSIFPRDLTGLPFCSQYNGAITNFLNSGEVKITDYMSRTKNEVKIEMEGLVWRPTTSFPFEERIRFGLDYQSRVGLGSLQSYEFFTGLEFFLGAGGWKGRLGGGVRLGWTHENGFRGLHPTPQGVVILKFGKGN